MQFLKKGTLGRFVTAEDGAEDSELVEVRMTAEEFREIYFQLQSLKQEIQSLEEEKRKERYDMQLTLEKYVGIYKRNLQQKQEELLDIKEEFEREIKKLKILNEEEKKELEAQKNLNWNLKRIAKERANANRKIVPKKAHSGYIVLYSAQYKENYRIRMLSKTIDVWKSVIQTYYDASIPLEEIKEEIWSELYKGVLTDIGIENVYNPEKNGKFQGYEDDLGCTLYKWEYRANFKAGYWEIIIWTTQALNMTKKNYMF